MPSNKRFTSDQDLITQIQNSKGDNSRPIMILLRRYSPLIKSFFRGSFVDGMDFDDWQQEASLVMLRIIPRYRLGRSSFGVFYRTGLRNRLYDLIRKQNARKRVPKRYLTSFDSDDKFYPDTLGDLKAVRPDNRLLVDEQLKRIFYECSTFERQILNGVLHRKTFRELASVYQCSVSQVVGAFQRCRRKSRRLLDLD